MAKRQHQFALKYAVLETNRILVIKAHKCGPANILKVYIKKSYALFQQPPNDSDDDIPRSASQS